MLKNDETRHFQSFVRKEKGRNTVINFGFQTGFLFKQLGIYAQFNPPVVTHSYSGYSSKTIASQVGISFRFHSKKDHAF